MNRPADKEPAATGPSSNYSPNFQNGSPSFPVIYGYGAHAVDPSLHKLEYARRELLAGAERRSGHDATDYICLQLVEVSGNPSLAPDQLAACYALRLVSQLGDFLAARDPDFAAHRCRVGRVEVVRAVLASH